MTPKLAYQSEPWFALLDERTRQPGAVRAHIAQRLGISRSALSQVLNGSGAMAAAQPAPRALRIACNTPSAVTHALT